MTKRERMRVLKAMTEISIRARRCDAAAYAVVHKMYTDEQRKARKP